jgi:hypothetical protein
MFIKFSTFLHFQFTINVCQLTPSSLGLSFVQTYTRNKVAVQMCRKFGKLSLEPRQLFKARAVGGPSYSEEFWVNENYGATGTVRKTEIAFVNGVQESGASTRGMKQRALQRYWRIG